MSTKRSTAATVATASPEFRSSTRNVVHRSQHATASHRSTIANGILPDTASPRTRFLVLVPVGTASCERCSHPSRCTDLRVFFVECSSVPSSIRIPGNIYFYSDGVSTSDELDVSTGGHLPTHPGDVTDLFIYLPFHRAASAGVRDDWS
jgi:hypothetical protein